MLLQLVNEGHTLLRGPVIARIMARGRPACCLLYSGTAEGLEGGDPRRAGFSSKLARGVGRRLELGGWVRPVLFAFWEWLRFSYEVLRAVEEPDQPLFIFTSSRVFLSFFTFVLKCGASAQPGGRVLPSHVFPGLRGVLVAFFFFFFRVCFLRFFYFFFFFFFFFFNLVVFFFVGLCFSASCGSWSLLVRWAALGTFLLLAKALLGCFGT